jgi:hypothetical protein
MQDQQNKIRRIVLYVKHPGYLFFRGRHEIKWAVELDNAYNLAAALAGVDGLLKYNFLTRHFRSMKSKKRLEPETTVEPATLPIPAGNDFTPWLLRNFTSAVGLSCLVCLLLSMWKIQMQLSHIRRYIEINAASNQIFTVS